MFIYTISAFNLETSNMKVGPICHQGQTKDKGWTHKDTVTLVVPDNELI